MPVQKSGKDEPAEEDDSLKHIDPLHQLIQLFSRTALTEKWYVTLLKWPAAQTIKLSSGQSFVLKLIARGDCMQTNVVFERSSYGINT